MWKVPIKKLLYFTFYLIVTQTKLHFYSTQEAYNQLSVNVNLDLYGDIS
jgi:hypothetical protein